MRPTYILLALALTGCGFLLALSLSGCADKPTYLTGRNLAELTFHLYSPNMGIHPDQSVVFDPNNPFLYAAPGEQTKWQLQSNAGPVAAFYGWATLNANAPGGEAQYYTAFDLQQIYETGQASETDLPTVLQMAIRAYQAVLDYFPDSVSYDASGTVSFDLATPSYKGIVALGGKVAGGWVLLKTSDGNDHAVRP